MRKLLFSQFSLLRIVLIKVQNLSIAARTSLRYATVTYRSYKGSKPSSTSDRQAAPSQVTYRSYKGSKLMDRQANEANVYQLRIVLIKVQNKSVFFRKRLFMVVTYRSYKGSKQAGWRIHFLPAIQLRIVLIKVQNSNNCTVWLDLFIGYVSFL